MCSIKTKQTEVNKSRSTIYRCDIRVRHNKSIRQEHTKHNDAQIKIHVKFSYARYNKQWLDNIIFKPIEMLGILHLRSLGYYKI